MEHTESSGAAPAAPAAQAPVPAQPADVSFLSIFSEARRAFKADTKSAVIGIVVLAATVLVTFIISGVIAGIVEGAGASARVGYALSGLLSSLAFTWLLIGGFWFYLRRYRGIGAGYSEIINGPRHQEGFISYFMYIFVVYGGILLLIVPGLIWSFRYLFVPMLALEGPIPFKDAMEKSARMTYGYKWRLFGYQIGFGLFAFAGLLAMGVGALFTFPVAMYAWIVTYEKLKARSESQALPAVPVGSTERIYLWGMTAGVLVWGLSTVFAEPADPVDAPALFDQAAINQAVSEGLGQPHALQPPRDHEPSLPYASAFVYDESTRRLQVSDGSFAATVPQGYMVTLESPRIGDREFRPASAKMTDASGGKVISIYKPIPETDALFGYEPVGPAEAVALSGTAEPASFQLRRNTLDDNIPEGNELIEISFDGGFNGGYGWYRCSFQMLSGSPKADPALQAFLSSVALPADCSAR